MNFYFSNMDSFLAMGGHGFYVWLAYAITFVALGFYFVFSASLTKRKQKELVKFYQRLESRQANIRES